MAVRPITIVGHKALHAPTKRVKEITDDTRALVEDMFETMEAANGVGLAANQVGVKQRIFVFDCPDDELGDNRRGVVINPKLEKGRVPAGEADEENDNEGCLSVPGEHFPTARADWAKVTGTDLDGNEIVIEGHGFFARMLQHETDHLDGYLYLDRLTPTMRLESREAVKDRGWQYDGITKWDPTELKAEDV
ncbi:peptide deformylase [Dermacoccus nishinomiyaensis]|uniref:peptide deformylase n=1 Tax=Dermacoccus TaxID=57495 RepID=UPI0001E643F4|nr:MULTISPECIES: peptide deformylase [Dermacoccus]HCQ18771.1 peptide deformylase [Dermacoccus sp.]EFP57903.1 peptide deformylase [Dermacoccus sp. Ellin185]MBO1758531.1 peptide deformylase [Dermacoccus sp. NHGro5]MCI0153851.1 peptide deformylase [Dermacoccus nishinomiyaensis]MCT1604462.1 peptide deformylase [Dermacoccus nishinomiyaensis]